MDNLTLMRLSDMQDDDAIDYFDIEEAEEKDLSNAENFKEKYKEFYTDIKINLKEDW